MFSGSRKNVVSKIARRETTNREHNRDNKNGRKEVEMGMT